MEYHETTETTTTDSYKDYCEGNPNAHPSEIRWKSVVYSVFYYTET